jgi:cephalosporin hydroxylase
MPLAKVLASLNIEASVAATHRQTAAGALKITEDLDRYRTAIEATRPDVVIECGTFLGKSAEWFANQGVGVVTIDKDPCGAPDTRITYLVGDTTGPDMAGVAAGLVRGRRVMVSLDSDHHAVHVRREIELYGPLVSPGCHLVVEDGIVQFCSPHLWPENVPGPLDAVEDLLVDDPSWSRDVAVEGLHPVTMSPLGWWQRNG